MLPTRELGTEGLTVSAIGLGLMGMSHAYGAPDERDERESIATIHRAIGRRTDIAYIPWFWRPIMLVIRLLPESVFKRMRL